jgi:tetratricopeptide (TPR) repeat protein
VLVLLAAGQVQLLQGNGGSAYEKFKYAEHLEPRHPQVQLWLGRAELVRGERLKAISCLERALDRKSSQAVGEGGLELEEHDAALIWLAEAYSADGKKNKGLALLGGAINGARPSLAIVLSWLRTQGLAQLVREKNVSLAIQTLRTAMTGAGTGEFNWIFSSQDLQLEAADWLTALQGKRE